MNLRKHFQFWFWGGASKINRYLTQNSAKPIITVSVNNTTRFYIRHNSSDALIVKEVWQLQEYAGHPHIKIKPADSVVVIGAQISVFSVMAGLQVPRGRVLSFEPNPENFRLLKSNLHLNQLQNVTPINLAVSDRVATKKLYATKLNSGGYSFFPKHPETQSMVKVKTITLAQIFSRYHLSRVDFMKVDVEGAEYDILLTATPATLRKIKNIVMEYHDHLAPGHHHSELVAHLQKAGFTVMLDSYILQPQVLKTGFLTAIRRD